VLLSGSPVDPSLGSGGSTTPSIVRLVQDVPAGTGTISGFIFDDANLNHAQDPGEAPLRNWEVYAANLDGSGELTAFSDSNGYYQIVGVPAGYYSVREVGQPGWGQTLPQTERNGGDYLVTVTPNTDSDGNNFGNSQHSRIDGTFFYDNNGNGIWDTGETTSPYWLVYLDANNNGVHDANEMEVRADSNGNYAFMDPPPGTYTVRAEHAAGWTQTASPDGPIAVGPGFTNEVSLNFGELHGAPTASIAGTFFYDANANGLQDAGEGPSPYWFVYIDANNNGVHDSNETEVRADGMGNYSFTGLSAGTYAIRAEKAAGWTQTSPAAGAEQLVTITAKQADFGVNFGEVQGKPAANGSISGTFFYDANSNGMWDSGESSSPYWLVYLDLNNNDVHDAGEPEMRGDANGRFTFSGLAAGWYSVRAESATGWTSTSQAVILTSGQNATGIDIAVARTASISGTFFYDSNGNGAWDSNETISPYWLVYIDANGNGAYDPGELEVRADASGRYLFTNLVAGEYVIRARTASGWQQTFPAPAYAWNITIGAGEAFTGWNFGERQIG
jgi:hypothetical protein